MRAGTKMMGGEISTRLTGRVTVIEHQANGRIRLTIDVIGTERPKLKYVPQRVRVSARTIPDGLKAGDVVTGVARLGPPSGPTRPGGYDFSFNSYFDGIGANGFFLNGPELRRQPRRCRRRRNSSPLVENLRTDLANHIRARNRRRPKARSPQHSSPASGPAFPKTSTKRCGAPGLPTSCRSPACTWRWSPRRSCSCCAWALPSSPISRPAARSRNTRQAPRLWRSPSISSSQASAVAAERSFIMIGVMLTAMLFDRAALTMRNLAISAIVIIAVSPHEVAGPSFQMSFAATAALIGAYAGVVGAPSRPGRRRRRRTRAVARKAGAQHRRSMRSGWRRPR